MDTASFGGYSTKRCTWSGVAEGWRDSDGHTGISGGHVSCNLHGQACITVAPGLGQDEAPRFGGNAQDLAGDAMLGGLLPGDIGRQGDFRDTTAAQHAAQMTPGGSDGGVVGAFHHAFDEVERQAHLADTRDADHFRDGRIDDQGFTTVLGACHADPARVLGDGYLGLGVARQQESAVGKEMALVGGVLGNLADGPEGNLDGHAVTGAVAPADFLVTQQMVHGREFSDHGGVLGFRVGNRDVDDALLASGGPEGLEPVGGGAGFGVKGELCRHDGSHATDHHARF